MTEYNDNIGFGEVAAKVDIIDGINKEIAFLKGVSLADLPESVRGPIEKILAERLNGVKDSYSVNDLTERIARFSTDEAARKLAAIPLNEAKNYNELLDALAAHVADPARKAPGATDLAAVLETKVATGKHPETYTAYSDQAKEASKLATLPSEDIQPGEPPIGGPSAGAPSRKTAPIPEARTPVVPAIN
ncbi:hypothetical protein HY031_03065, partial [Candidatus Gottesmanbacteria bacterium]|nr:hypothetical protein [Candidatus Gottesmanbacteria bacterium]